MFLNNYILLKLCGIRFAIRSRYQVLKLTFKCYTAGDGENVVVSCNCWAIECIIMILDVEKLVFIRPMIDNFPDFHNTNDASALFIYLHFILS